MKRSLLLLSLAACPVALALACGGGSSSTPTAGPEPTTTPTAPTTPAPTTTTPPGPTKRDDCVAGAAVCLAKDKTRRCETTPEGTRWVEATCQAGSGCVGGACAAGACSDECTAGETTAGKTCAPWDVAKGAAAPALDATTKLHDRSRAYLGWMKRGPMLAGAIGSPHFTDTTYTQVNEMRGLGDSAIWTGTYLAAEALRLRATGSADARARVRELVTTMHLFARVTGTPGLLARWVKESSKTYPFVLGDLNCAAPNRRTHCNHTYDGKKYDYLGHISRDQYQGLMLGYGVAYDALGPADEDLRELIRGDVVTLVEELMKERSVPVKIVFNGTPLSTTAKMRFVVLDPSEMNNGAIELKVDSGDAQDSDMYGFQEFMPNLAHLVRQLPGLGFLPDIPRASSAIMLASFFRVALRATEGVPTYAARRKAIEDYYFGHKGEGGNIKDWLDVAKTYQFATRDGCGNGYFGSNITWEPLYNLALLEDSTAYAPIVRNDVLKGKLWEQHKNHKNSFFAFIYAGTFPGGDAPVASEAATQLAQFPAPPRVHNPVDLRNSPKYPSRQNNCTDQVDHGTAVDVGDRQTGDFMWQRHPWGLLDAGDLNQVEPGVDYLAAYWLGRRHALMTDDTPGVCLAWQ